MDAGRVKSSVAALWRHQVGPRAGPDSHGVSMKTGPSSVNRGWLSRKTSLVDGMKRDTSAGKGGGRQAAGRGARGAGGEVKVALALSCAVCFAGGGPGGRALYWTSTSLAPRRRAEAWLVICGRGTGSHTTRSLLRDLCSAPPALCHRPCHLDGSWRHPAREGLSIFNIQY